MRFAAQPSFSVGVQQLAAARPAANGCPASCPVSPQSYGTASFAAPELLTQGKLTKAADVYSLGIISEWHWHDELSATAARCTYPARACDAGLKSPPLAQLMSAPA